jgi:phage-related protein
METGKQKERTIIFYKDYFRDFLGKQNENVKEKIFYSLDLIRLLPRVPVSFLKHIENTDGLYEIRVETGGDIFRIFCFFDKGNLIILANGFQKKTQKTPRQEIKKALQIKSEYESGKK